MSDTPLEPVTLRPARWRWLLCFVFGVVFAVIAFWIASRQSSASGPAWIAGALFAFFAIFAALVAFGNGAYLRLDRRGFVYQTPLHTVVFAWKDTSDVAVHKWNQHVLTVSVDGRRRKILLPDTYGRTARELCDLMNAYRAQARRETDLTG